MTVSEAAFRLGISRQRVHQLLKAGRILGAYQKDEGGTWVIPVSALSMIQPGKTPNGRPRKSQKPLDK